MLGCGVNKFQRRNSKMAITRMTSTGKKPVTEFVSGCGDVEGICEVEPDCTVSTVRGSAGNWSSRSADPSPDSGCRLGVEFWGFCVGG